MPIEPDTDPDPEPVVEPVSPYITDPPEQDTEDHSPAYVMADGLYRLKVPQ